MQTSADGRHEQVDWYRRRQVQAEGLSAGDAGRRIFCGQTGRRTARRGQVREGESRIANRTSRRGRSADDYRSQLGLRLVSAWKERPAAARAAAGRGRVGFSSRLGLR